MKNLMSARAIPLLVVLFFLGCVFPSLPNTSAQEITAPSGPLFLAGGRDQDLWDERAAKFAEVAVQPLRLNRLDQARVPERIAARGGSSPAGTHTPISRTA